MSTTGNRENNREREERTFNPGHSREHASRVAALVCIVTENYVDRH